MIIDFHVHGKIRSKFPFDEEKFLLAIEEAKSEGLNSFTLTEHCHANNFTEGYNFLSRNYSFVDDYFDINGFRVFYGVEVTTKQKFDVLIIGKPSNIIELKTTITDELGYRKDIDIDILFELLNLEKFLIILAHPYRENTEFSAINDNILNKLDAIELNARDLYDGKIEIMKEKIIKLSKEFKVPIICGSDTHYFISIGSVKNIFDIECTHIEQMKEQIKLGRYKTEISSNLPIRIKSSIIIKKLICNK